MNTYFGNMIKLPQTYSVVIVNITSVMHCCSIWTIHCLSIICKFSCHVHNTVIQTVYCNNMGHFVYQHAGQVYVCYHLLLGGGAVSEFTSTVYPAQIHIFSQCGHHNHFHDEQLRQAPHQTPSQHIHVSNHSSCKSIVNVNPSASSGYYNITTTNAVQVYCDIEGTHCGGEGGWTRVTLC